MKQTEQNKKSARKRVWLWSLLMMSVVVIVSGTLAAYTHQSYVKGVAAANESSMLFLSDNLRRYPMGTAAESYILQKLIANKMDNDTVSVSFYIRNYKGAKVNENTIQYHLAITPSDADSQYTVSGTGLTETAFKTGYTGEFSMTGGEATQQTFTLQLPRTVIDAGGSFTVTATPANVDSSLATNNYMLAAVIQPNESGTVSNGFHCTGTFADQSGNNAPYDFDAFNYVITVVNAAEGKTGKVTLTWNSEYVEPDPFFIAEMQTKAGTTVGENSITFYADNGSQLVQFYRKQGKKQSTEEADTWQQTWDAMNSQNIIQITGEEVEKPAENGST